MGHLLASAHDVVREARIISALADTDVPAPRILGVTTDSDVPLVLMEFVDGLADLAGHKPYAQRQLKRWAGQWELPGRAAVR